MVGRNSGIGNVNFDYNGPPVAVSNKTALDLVTQFGIQNAWYAFLKLRGLSPFKDDAEKDAASKRFRTRIRQLRRNADSLRDRADELSVLLGKEFSSADLTSSSTSSQVVDLATNSSVNATTEQNVMTKDAPKDVLESTSLDDEKDDSDGLGKLVIDEDVSFSTSSASSPAKFQTPISETINSVLSKLKASGLAAAISRQTISDLAVQPIPLTTTALTTTSSNPFTTTAVVATTSMNSATTSTSLTDTASIPSAKNDLPASTHSVSNPTVSVSESSAERRHRETIDDVVSSVMAKIRNNEPFDNKSLFSGNLPSTFSSTSTAQATAVHAVTTSKGRGKAKNVFVKQQPPFISSTSGTAASTIATGASDKSGQADQFVAAQSLNQLAAAAASSAMLVDSSTGAIVTFPQSTGQIAPQIGVGGHIMPDQVTILSNFTEIIRSSTSSHQAAAPQLTPVTKIITQSSRDVSSVPHKIQQQHFQQQQQITQLPAGSTIQFPSYSLPLSAATAAGGIPIGISPQGTITLPNNVTVQSLLQSLQQQAKKQQLQLAQFQLSQPMQQTPSIQLQVQPEIPQQTIQQLIPAFQQQLHQQSQQILPDSSSQDVGSGTAPQRTATSFAPVSAIVNSSENASKVVKKRQYVRRKNVITASAPIIESKTDIYNKSSAFSAQKRPLSKHSNTTCSEAHFTPATSTIASANNSAETSAVSKSSGKKMIAKSPAETVAADKSLRKEERENDNEEKLTTPKRAYTKKGAKKSDDELLNSVTPKNAAKYLDERKAEPIRSAKTTKTQTKSEEETLRILELETQLAKSQRQLNSERNKTSAQKKRIDKLQADLEKNIDAIQLVQIDLACQKTDNNNLMAENITLKAELQKFKAKESKATSGPKKVGRKPKDQPTTSKDAKGQRAAVKRQNSSKTEEKEEDGSEQSSFDKSPEPGRRQSKRICVTRKNFLYQNY